MDLDSVLKGIKDSVEKLVTLEIITAVGPVAIVEKRKDSPGTSSYALDKDLFKPETKLIVTRINLLQGDITTVIPEEFSTPQYQWLRDFHATREKQGLETVQKILEAVKSLVNLVEDLKSKG